MQYTIMDDDVVAAPINRCDSKPQQPTRPHENHGLHMEHIPTWMESQYKQQTQSLVVHGQGSLAITSKIQGTQKCTLYLLYDLGSHHMQYPKDCLIDVPLNANSCLTPS